MIMKAYNSNHYKNRGFSLVELLISMAITLVLVLAASMVYLNVRETDTTQAKTSDSIETGTFALQLIGRDIAQAGSYPVVMPPTTIYFPQGKVIDNYPPIGWTTESPNAVYLSGIFGCEGGKFNSKTAACDATAIVAPNRSAPDSIVLNYFTSESDNANIGNRNDCTGSDVGNDVINKTRKLNSTPDLTKTPPVPTTENKDLPPQLPLFVSNRYALADTTTEIEKFIVTTMSLACSGNGASGSKTNDLASVYQPILLGVEDLQITYGVFDIPNNTASLSLAPVSFFTATGVNALIDQTFEDKTYKPWDRVTAVRVCMMTRTLGSSARINDASGVARKYQDCTDDVAQSYSSSDGSIRKRHVQVFAVRNRLTQSY